MARWYSDHFGADGEDDSAIASPDIVIPAGVGHGRLRFKRAYAKVTDGAANDEVRMFSHHTDDRLFAMYVNTDGGFDVSSSADVGIYLQGDSHDGTVIDVDLFDAAVDVTSAIDDLEEILCDGALGGEDRGSKLWQMANIGVGATTYGATTQAMWDVVITLTGNDTTAGKLVLMSLYTAGD